jgi:hypothetical protein
MTEPTTRRTAPHPPPPTVEAGGHTYEAAGLSPIVVDAAHLLRRAPSATGLAACPVCGKWVGQTSRGNVRSHSPTAHHPEAVRVDGRCTGSGSPGQATAGPRPSRAPQGPR